MKFGKWLRKLVEGESPRTLYVRRDVVNHESLRSWYGQQGLELDGGLHVTIAFSRNPILWSLVAPNEQPLLALSTARMERFGGDEGALVLLLESRMLENEWQIFKTAGASWDYPSYRPHVTLTYNKASKNLIPFTGILHLGPQIYDVVT